MMYRKLVEALGVLAAALIGSMYMWTKNDYERIARSMKNISIDGYMQSTPTLTEKLQCVLLHWTTRWTKKIHAEAIPLVAENYVEASNEFSGLQRTRAASRSEVPKKRKNLQPPLVIGTIRMGFGHYRIAYAVASYATAKKEPAERDIYFHDIASIGDGKSESSLVDDGETLYSLASRIMTELPNPIERLLSSGTSEGGTNALRMQVQAASLMTSLMDDLDKDCPVIATHPLVGSIAIEAGFNNVINLVVDNHPQWFVVVPGALNLVQGPRLYRELLKMGVPESELELAGHWNPKNIVDTIPEATERRIRRVESQQALRLLIPVGGAGAQQSFLLDLVKECAPLVKEGKLQLFLNAGDHDHMRTAFEEQLEATGLEHETVTDTKACRSLEEQLKLGKEPNKPVTLFAYKDMYDAVTTTDRLVPHSDVLVCKPSEMAFYAVPKLMIRRVGDHEAKSAVRAAEVGEGTLEASTIPEVMREIHQFYSKPGDLVAMNRMIQTNHAIGMYDGAKIAVERALERATSQSLGA